MADLPSPEILLRPKQAAEILQVSQVQVYRLVRQGELPAVIIGRSVRFRPGQLAEFIRQNSVNTQKLGNGKHNDHPAGDDK
jgi:excisionase family DNA binding protein